MKALTVSLLVAGGIVAVGAVAYYATRDEGPARRMGIEDAARDAVSRPPVVTGNGSDRTQLASSAILSVLPISEYAQWTASLSDIDRTTERGFTADIREWLAGMEPADRMLYMARMRPRNTLDSSGERLSFT